MYYLFFFAALICFSEEVRSRCHVKHTLPRWPAESGGVGDGTAGGGDPSAAHGAGANQSGAGGQNVRRQKSWDMLDQSAIQYARQSHKVQPHQVGLGGLVSEGILFRWVGSRDAPVEAAMIVSRSQLLTFCSF